MMGLLKTPSTSDAHTEGMAKKNQKFGDSGSLAQEMETGFVFNRMPSEPPLTLFAEDSPASLFPQQESERVRETTVFSGRKCYELYGRFTHLGCLAKMLLESSIWHSSKCVLTWKVRVMKSSRLLFLLQASTPRTKGIGSGLLATPRASDPEKRGNIAGDPRNGLPGQIAMLRTPNQQNWKNASTLEEREGHTLNLQDQVRAMLPTPQASDGGHGHAGTWTTTQISLHNVIEGKGKQLDGSIVPAAHGKNHGLKLQPAFALWMMGFPEDWCNLKDGE